MSVIDCPPWCDGLHAATDLLKLAPEGSVTHRTNIRLGGEDKDLVPLAWIESQAQWRTEPGSGERTEGASDPGICISPFFSEVYLEPPEIAELLEIVGKAQRRLALIKSHNR
ncbi:hypothetical protein ACIGH6_17100 [Brachybacterium paraconglomeratum]|uniref:hypothetical protein n=1 Tax=Brachybacterium paraconglomeratum TaxID=173362 RepID=UPI0037C86404